MRDRLSGSSGGASLSALSCFPATMILLNLHFKNRLGICIRCSRQSFSQIAPDLKMLIVDRVLLIPSPDWKTIFCKNVDYSFGHSRPSINSVQVIFTFLWANMQCPVLLLAERIFHRINVYR